MSLTCVLLIAASLCTSVQGGGAVSHAYQQYKTRQGRRMNYWGNTEPRAIPSYTVVSDGSYYTVNNIVEQSFGGDYYRAQEKCDDMGDACWGFQTTFGCTDRLGCSQFLILEDPMRARKIDLAGTRVYSKKTQTWDAVPLQCTGLNKDDDVDNVGACEETCAQDLECEIYQWYDDNTCWKGKSNNCHGDKVVVEGYRARPVFWAFTPTECDGLKYDSTADNDLAQCQYNCQWDMTCNMYEYKRNGQCHRGQGERCKSLVSPTLDSGKKDEKFKWKRIRKDCSGLNLDQDAATADECKQSCADSQHCSIWQFKANGQCFKGHSTQCSPDKDKTVEDGGYRWYINNGDSEEDNTDDGEGIGRRLLEFLQH